VTGVAALLVSQSAAAAVGWVVGEVPDWNQPYTYVAPPFGPGPDPTPAAAGDLYDAWCAPTSASNLFGHWEDVKGKPIADGVLWTFPPPPVHPWPDGPTWHDNNADDTRPPPGPNPAIRTDGGWYMDTNHTGASARGNAGPPHIGTFLKDIHAGIQGLLDKVLTGFTTGIRAGTFALGLDSSGIPATPHPDDLSAFAEIKAEIDANRTILVAWKHWTVALQGSPPLAPVVGATDESQFGGDYFVFGASGPDPWGNNEEWETNEDPALNLGHVTTAVGYIEAGSPEDPLILGVPTNWVIVHDNAPVFPPRNVIVPLGPAEYAGVWDANINVNFEAQIPALGAGGVAALAGLFGAVVVAALVRRRGVA
jgi:hypothetical protein